MSWFWRGAQSAVFYYVSCAPCASYAFERRRAKQKSKADKETRELMKYASRHSNGQLLIPDEVGGTAQERITGVGAFTTNIYWREDMMMGPQPKKGRHRANTLDDIDTGKGKENRHRDRETEEVMAKTGARRSTTAASVDSVGAGSLNTRNYVHYRDRETDTAGPHLHVAEGQDSAARKRYQRPDELLWGEPIIEKDWAYYARGRNPEISPLCPPIVSTKPSSPSQASWMLQPPPPAKVMEGYQTPIAWQPIARVPSNRAKAAGRQNVGDGRRGETIQIPEQAHVCELGDRMTDLHAPTRSKRKSRLLFDRVDESGDFTSRPRTPEQSRNWHGNLSDNCVNDLGREVSRNGRPSSICSSSDLYPSRQSHSPGNIGFDTSWTFPRRMTSRPERKLVPATLDNTLKVDGYHSEPELFPTLGVSFQDFAAAQQLGHIPNATGTLCQIPQSAHRSPNSRPQSDSNTSESRSIQSSRSSLHPLEELVAPDNNFRLSKSASTAKDGHLGALGSDLSLVSPGEDDNTADYWSSDQGFKYGADATYQVSGGDRVLVVPSRHR